MTSQGHCFLFIYKKFHKRFACILAPLIKNLTVSWTHYTLKCKSKERESIKNCSWGKKQEVILKFRVKVIAEEYNKTGIQETLLSCFTSCSSAGAYLCLSWVKQFPACACVSVADTGTGSPMTSSRHSLSLAQKDNCLLWTILHFLYYEFILNCNNTKCSLYLPKIQTMKKWVKREDLWGRKKLSSTHPSRFFQLV